MDAAFVFALVSAVLLTIFVPHEASPHKEGSAQKHSALASLREQVILFKEPPIIFGVLLFTFGVGAVYTFYGYVAPYLETYLGFPPAQSRPYPARVRHHLHGVRSDLGRGGCARGHEAHSCDAVRTRARPFCALALQERIAHLRSCPSSSLRCSCIASRYSCITMFRGRRTQAPSTRARTCCLRRAHLVQHRHRLRHARGRSCRDPRRTWGSRSCWRHIRSALLHLRSDRTTLLAAHAGFFA